MGNRMITGERDVHARIKIINVEGTSKGGSSLKTAGSTPYTSIYDEVGKYPFLGAYLAGRPSHMMHGKMRGMILSAGTGGNVERSQDAQKVMNDPAKYHFIIMDYDLLNKHTVNPTWRICKSGCFVPGQMSHAYEKKKITLAEYLDKPKSTLLKKIPIEVTDFDKNTKVIRDRLNELANGIESFTSKRRWLIL